MNSTEPNRSKHVQPMLEDLPEIEGDEFAPDLRTLENDLGTGNAYENFSIESYDS